MHLPPHSRLISSALVALNLLVCGCTTVSNRRDLYFPQCVWGPYTKMLHHGIPKTTTVIIVTTTTGSGKNVVKPQR